MHNEKQAVQVNNLINVGFFIISNCKVFFLYVQEKEDFPLGVT